MKVANPNRYSRDDVVGKYRLLNHIARSATCDVWETMHVGTNRRHAVKLLLPGTRDKSEGIRTLRFEHTVGSSLKHPAVIRTDEFLQDEEAAFLAMEFFPAPSLKRHIVERGEEFSLLTSTIAHQAASGLAYLHDQGWIHRDIKPENFLVNDGGDVRLIDFSLAQRQRRWWNSFFGGNSQIQGTRTYISPEQIRKKSVDARSDIYSFGCVLFELVSGRPPFTASKTNDLLNKHLKSPAPLLKSAAGEVSPRFSKLIKQMLAKDADNRPDSMDEVLERLQTTAVFEN